MCSGMDEELFSQLAALSVCVDMRVDMRADMCVDMCIRHVRHTAGKTVIAVSKTVVNTYLMGTPSPP